MMKTLGVSGMSCNGCRTKVENFLNQLEGVEATVDLTSETAHLKSKNYSLESWNESLASLGDYRLSELQIQPEEKIEKVSKLSTYYPLLLILCFLLIAVGIQQWNLKTINWAEAMTLFMGLFFMIFSFFKLLDIKGFAYSFSMYDIVAEKWKGYGFIYPFIELGLGIALLTLNDLKPVLVLTVVVMSIGIIGVTRSVLNKKKIQCACLGTVFDLPMSQVTIIEDGLMIVMALAMLFI